MNSTSRGARVRFALAVAVGAVMIVEGCGGAAPRGRNHSSGNEVVTVTTHSIDGIPLVYDVRGEGDLALVFVHCWACNREFWREQVDVFARDHRVVTIDLPGHGASGKARSTWSIEGLGADVRTVLEEQGLSRVILIGHSMGGPVCLEAARLLPGRVRGIIAVDTLHDAEFRIPEETILALAARYESNYAGAMRDFIGSMFPPGADSSIVRWVIDQASAADPGSTIALFEDFPNLDLRKMFRDARVPIRAINAAPTRAGVMPTSLEHNRKYADFDVTLIDGVGHFLQLEKPQEVNSALKKFIAEMD